MSSPFTIRPARPDEADALSALAQRSKANWGYDRDFLDAVRGVLTFTAADVERGSIYVLEREGELSGVYRLTGNPPDGELSDLWLDPNAIGRGLGRALFDHALRSAALLGYEALLIESDPNAEGFYLTMGAVRIGEQRSAAGRMLPLLRVAVPSGAARSS
jgi:GNAT superfamily N-acetyltransferase